MVTNSEHLLDGIFLDLFYYKCHHNRLYFTDIFHDQLISITAKWLLIQNICGCEQNFKRNILKYILMSIEQRTNPTCSKKSK